MKNFIRTLAKRKRLTTGVIVAVLAVMLIILVTTRNNSAATRYLTATISRGTIAKTVSVTGNIQANNEQDGSFAVDPTANVTEIDVKPGDTVKPGQVLAKIDATNLNNKLVQAQSQLNQAYNNLNNTLTKGHYTNYDIYNLREAIRIAQSNYDVTNQNLGKATLVADFAGQVVSVGMKVNNPAGTNTIVVVDPNSLYIEIVVNESDLDNLKKDMAADVTFAALDNKSYVGKVTDISLFPDITSNVVSYKAKISLVANDNKLQLGFTGKAVITLASKDNVLLVPTAAIKNNGDTYYLEIMNNGKITNKNIEVGMVGDTETEVTSGVNENDVVVVSTLEAAQAATTQQTGGFGFGAGGGAIRTFTGGGNNQRRTTGN